MRSTFPLALAALIAAGVLFNGSFYLISPRQAFKSFGLNPPALDAHTLAWLRLKGIRDVASGLVVLTVMLAADRRMLGMVMLAYAIIPFGDMSIVLGSGGSKGSAFSIHALTCAVMLVVGLLLIHAI